MIYGRILRSMTDRAARTAAAGSWGDLGLRLIDDFDDDLTDGTIARFPTGILSLRSSYRLLTKPSSYTRSRNSSSTELGGPCDVWSLRSMQTGISLLTTLRATAMSARRNKGRSTASIEVRRYSVVSRLLLRLQTWTCTFFAISYQSYLGRGTLKEQKNDWYLFN